jgi:uncharacterized LabA/DUF88 family protein
MERGKALWLIDAGYLFRGAFTVEEGYQFDYKKLREKIEEDGPLWRAYYLNSTPAITSDQTDRFHNWLQTAQPEGPQIITKLYELKRTRVEKAYCDNCASQVMLKCPQNRPGEYHPMFKEQQKGVDVGLSTLALTLGDQYDTLVLSSGDGDLLDAIEYLYLHGKRIELVVFKANVASALQSRTDRIYWIDEFKDQVRA